MSSVPRPAVRDRIILTRIGVYAHHGRSDDERGLGQRFHISVAAKIDLREAGRTDDLAASVSYADIALLVRRVALGDRFVLVEALAEAVAAAILSDFPPIAEVVVTVDQPGVGVPVVLDGVSLAITRGR